MGSPVGPFVPGLKRQPEASGQGLRPVRGAPTRALQAIYIGLYGGPTAAAKWVMHVLDKATADKITWTLSRFDDWEDMDPSDSSLLEGYRFKLFDPTDLSRDQLHQEGRDYPYPRGFPWNEGEVKDAVDYENHALDFVMTALWSCRGGTALLLAAGDLAKGWADSPRSGSHACLWLSEGQDTWFSTHANFCFPPWGGRE